MLVSRLKRRKMVNMIEETAYSFNAGPSYTEPFDMAKLRFIESRRAKGLSTYCRTFDHKYEEKDMFRLLTDVLNILKDATYTFFNSRMLIIQDDDECFVCVDKNEITIYGNEADVDAYMVALMDEHSKSNVYWYYLNRGSYDYQRFQMEYTMTAHDEHYPYIRGGVNSYMDEYMNSKASILLLMGEPGTGKTSFLKEMIKRYRLNAMVTYEEKLMGNDEFYIDFLRNEDRDILIIEDADLLLTSRESDSNKAMARLLNLSDGLINVIKKKVVFSTNLADMTRIDDAIIRPGRCFDVLDFRKLEGAEINKVCELHKLPLMDVERANLSEIFNREERSFKKSKMGF